MKSIYPEFFVEPSSYPGLFVSHCPALGILSQGETEEEATEAIVDAIDLIRKLRRMDSERVLSKVRDEWRRRLPERIAAIDGLLSGPLEDFPTPDADYEALVDESKLRPVRWDPELGEFVDRYEPDMEKP